MGKGVVSSNLLILVGGQNSRHGQIMSDRMTETTSRCWEHVGLPSKSTSLEKSGQIKSNPTAFLLGIE